MLMKSKSKYFCSPRLEALVMLGTLFVSFGALGCIAALPGQVLPGEMTNAAIVLILFAFFLLSTGIAMIAVIAGIGGGVIFTPIMLAFTDVNSVIVRATGVIIAMFSGMISTGVFIKKGIGNYRLCLILTFSQGLGALAGATLAVTAAQSMGAVGEGFLRAGLGLILLALAVYFLLGGKKIEWPSIGNIDGFTKWLRLNGHYFEESMGTTLNYEVVRAPLGIVLVCVVGVLGGFFGMGGGWAITPALNLGMGIPLKLAAANSHVILGIGSCMSVWPYIFAGGVIPFLALPWISGQVVGGFIGSHVLARIKVRTIRLILIGIMVFTSFSLATKGLEILGLMARVPPLVQVCVFIATLAAILIAVFISAGKEKNHAG
jgi:uncharacterized membrane protein YfcA